MNIILNFMQTYQVDKVFFNNHILIMYGYCQMQRMHNVSRLNWEKQINSQ